MRSSRGASVSTCTQPSNDLPLVSTRSLYTCEMSDQDSNSVFDINDLMTEFLTKYHLVLDNNPNNFVEVYATFHGLNALNVSFYVNNMCVKVIHHTLDSEGNFTLSNIVEIRRHKLNEDNQMVEIVYNGNAIYTYPIVRNLNDQEPGNNNDEDQMDAESLPELEPPGDYDYSVHDVVESDEELPSDYEEPVPFVDESEDSDEELCLWERILKSIVNRKSSLLNLSPSKSVSVDYRPGEDTPHSPVNSEDGLLQECSSPEVGSEIVSEDGLLQRCNTPPSPSMLSDLFGRSNPPSPLPPNPPSPLPSPHMSDDEEDVLMLSSIFGESDPPSPRISGFGSSESNPPSPIGNRPESPEPVIVNGYPIFMGQRQPSDPSSDRDPDEFAEFVIIDDRIDKIEDETIEE